MLGFISLRKGRRRKRKKKFKKKKGIYIFSAKEKKNLDGKGGK